MDGTLRLGYGTRVVSRPFIKSAGGKRLLAPRILSLMPGPAAYDVYCEPFLGGGAVYFALWGAHGLDEKTVILGDADADLIHLYAAVRDQAVTLIQETTTLINEAHASCTPQKVYEDVRRVWNQGGDARTPARHLFLRKGAWNGLWRQNRKGEMNVPWRGKPPQYVGMELMNAMAAFNHPRVELLDWDFRRYESDAVFIGPRTLVYCDPPYLGGTNSFMGYTAGGWNETDLVDLLTLCATWTDRGAHVVLSHSDTACFRDHLAVHWPDAAFNSILARRAINSDGRKRGPVHEAIVVGKPQVDRRHVTLHSMSQSQAQ